MSDKKRPLDASAEAGSNKKLKSSDNKNGAIGGSSEPLTGAALIAQKRAEIAAKMAAMKNAAFSTPSSSAASSGLAAPQPIRAIPKINALTASPSVSAGPTPASSSPASGTPTPGAAGVTDDLNRRVMEAKRRVAEAQGRLAVKDNPYMSLPSRPTSNSAKRPSSSTNVNAEAQQGAGLKMTAHPLLLDTSVPAPQSKKDRYKPMQPKFASIKANTRNQPTPPPPAPVRTPDVSNPYSAGASTSSPGAGGVAFEGAPRERAGRSFRFNPKGKYVALGNQMRQEVQLEALKQRIAESARKAGLDDGIGGGSGGSLVFGVERGVKRAPPPAAEWWDAPLLPNSTYDDLDNLEFESLNISNEESPITIYVQHPIPIKVGTGKEGIELKPMMLTKKERKKMRKLKRASELQDKRDRIRMGLLPPDPPKVRMANLMKVLASDAIQDPTRVEARVRREVAMRKHGHEKMNAERKLTDEQRKEKMDEKKSEQEKKGIWGAVFKIKKLTDPAHQFKVRKNAEQLNLTGVCIFNPHFSMVYVEGAAKYIRTYKRLMVHRIAWTEAARPRGAEDVELQDPNSDAEPDAATAAEKEKAKEAEDKAKEKADEVTSLEDNRCDLVWEGQLRDRGFSNFKARSCPTDSAAKELLGEKLKGYWDQAKNWKWEEEELF